LGNLSYENQSRGAAGGALSIGQGQRQGHHTFDVRRSAFSTSRSRAR